MRLLRQEGLDAFVDYHPPRKSQVQVKKMFHVEHFNLLERSKALLALASACC